MDLYEYLNTGKQFSETLYRAWLPVATDKELLDVNVWLDIEDIDTLDMLIKAVKTNGGAMPQMLSLVSPWQINTLNPKRYVAGICRVTDRALFEGEESRFTAKVVIMDTEDISWDLYRFYSWLMHDSLDKAKAEGIPMGSRKYLVSKYTKAVEVLTDCYLADPKQYDQFVTIIHNHPLSHEEETYLKTYTFTVALVDDPIETDVDYSAVLSLDALNPTHRKGTRYMKDTYGNSLVFFLQAFYKHFSYYEYNGVYTKPKGDTNMVQTDGNTPATITDIIKMKMMMKIVSDKGEIDVSKLMMLNAFSNNGTFEVTDAIKAKMMASILKDGEKKEDLPLDKLMLVNMLDRGRIEPMELVKNKMLLSMAEGDGEPDLEKLAIVNMLDKGTFDASQILMMKLVEKM